MPGGPPAGGTDGKSESQGSGPPDWIPKPGLSHAAALVTAFVDPGSEPDLADLRGFPDRRSKYPDRFGRFPDRCRKLPVPRLRELRLGAAETPALSADC